MIKEQRDPSAASASLHGEFIEFLVGLALFAFGDALTAQRWSGRKLLPKWSQVILGGLLTANGGGTVRDLLAAKTPFWISAPEAMLVAGLAIALASLFEPHFGKRDKRALQSADHLVVWITTTLAVAGVAEMIRKWSPFGL